MTLDLQAIFGEPLATAQVIDRPKPATVPTADLGPSGEPQAPDPKPLGFNPTDWIRQPDATGRWGWERVDLDSADWPNFDVMPNPAPCPRCGSLELWESMAADIGGIEPARWRCLKCDPPTKARRLADLAATLRQRAAHRRSQAPDTPQDATEAAGPTRDTSGQPVLV